MWNIVKRVAAFVFAGLKKFFPALLVAGVLLVAWFWRGKDLLEAFTAAPIQAVAPATSGSSAAAPASLMTIPCRYGAMLVLHGQELLCVPPYVADGGTEANSPCPAPGKSYYCVQGRWYGCELNLKPCGGNGTEFCAGRTTIGHAPKKLNGCDRIILDPLRELP